MIFHIYIMVILVLIFFFCYYFQKYQKSVSWGAIKPPEVVETVPMITVTVTLPPMYIFDESK